MAFAQVRRAVFEGVEIDEGEELEIRVESAVGATKAVAGVEARMVHVFDYEDGELVEDTEDYYAQDAAGVVYYLGESVDEYDRRGVTPSIGFRSSVSRHPSNVPAGTVTVASTATTVDRSSATPGARSCSKSSLTWGRAGMNGSGTAPMLGW